MAARTLKSDASLLDCAEPLIADDSGLERRGRSAETRTAPALHVQLADIIREKIYAREWGSGSKIPSEHELMVRFGLARGTVRRAITLLVDEGLLVRRHGKGTFVAEPGISHAAGTRPFSFAATLREQGKDFTTRVVDSWATPAPADVANELEISPGTDVMFLRRVRSVDGEPIMCQESWLNLSECPGLADADFTSEPLFDAVQRCAGRRRCCCSNRPSVLSTSGPSNGAPPGSSRGSRWWQTPSSPTSRSNRSGGPSPRGCTP